MLEFKNLYAGYDGVEKLHGIDAQLKKGKLTAIIGVNGCGKSTLLKCAAGLLKPMDGKILLDGMDVRTISEKERARRISYMPQSRIAPEISVWQLVEHGRYPHLKWGQKLRAQDREIVHAAIGQVGLENYAHTAVHQLSGGERQRAYLAMMLAQQTEIMLLDEPTSYLDLSSQFALMSLLQELKRDFHSVAVVLHDLALALEYADEILLLHGGKRIAAGSPQEIYTSGEIQRAFNIEIQQMDGGRYLCSAGKG